MNSVQVSGRVASPEVKEYAGGKMLKFSVADSQKRNGEEKTNWFRCVLFGEKRVDGLETHVTKGRFVSVTGRLEMNEVEREGSKTIYTSLLVDQIELGPKKDAKAESPTEQNYTLKTDSTITTDDIEF